MMESERGDEREAGRGGVRKRERERLSDLCWLVCACAGARARRAA